jgi:hypothetical protein
LNLKTISTTIISKKGVLKTKPVDFIKPSKNSKAVISSKM